MLTDGISLIEGSNITNATIASGNSFPSSPTLGELFFRSDSNKLYAYNGASWITGGMENIVEDTTPQLGGDLDVNGHDIVGVTAVSPPSLRIQPGTGTGSSTAVLTLSGGDVSSAGSAVLAGDIQVKGGNNEKTSGTAVGGVASISGGNATSSSLDNGIGGDVEIKGGQGRHSGGNVVISAGIDTSTSSAPGVIQIKGAVSSLVGEMQFMEANANGISYVSIKPPTSITTNRTWTLPQDDPSTAAGKFLTTDSSGNLSFSNVSNTQPGFLAYLASTVSAGQTVSFTNTSDGFNQGNHYSTSTYRFTAPVTGIYHFSWILIGGTVSSLVEGGLMKNAGGTMVCYIFAPAISGGRSYVSGGITIKLNANDYVYIYTTVGGVYGDTFPNATSYFSGHLVG